MALPQTRRPSLTPERILYRILTLFVTPYIILSSLRCARWYQDGAWRVANESGVTCSLGKSALLGSLTERENSLISRPVPRRLVQVVQRKDVSQGYEAQWALGLLEAMSVNSKSHRVNVSRCYEAPWAALLLLLCSLMLKAI